MRELASGMTARELVPGVPEDIERLATRLLEYSEAARTAVARLRSMDQGLWIGDAAEAFSAQVGKLPAKLSRAAGAFEDAALALRSYVSVLREAQWTAGKAVELFEEGEQRSRSSKLEQGASPPFGADRHRSLAPLDIARPDEDPGDSLRAEARHLFETARDELEAAAWRTARVLDDAGDAAPNRPGFFHRALHVAGEVVGGATEATVGMATFAFKLTPVYQLIDPEGYVENLTGLGKGVLFGVTHPVSFAKAIVDWDTWAESPGRAIGHLLPTIALTAATAGAGSAGRGAAASEALEGAGVRQAAAVGRAAASGEAGGAVGGAVTRSTARAFVDPDKFRYLFGEVESNAHNAARSAQNLAHMERHGLRGSNGRSLLQSHLDAVVRDSTNVAREFSNQYGTFQIRESLFAGPSGAFAKFETTWQLMPDGSLRLTTLIPFGGS